MRRLLWKEWVETRWLLLGLLAAPPFAMLVFKDNCGFPVVGYGLQVGRCFCWMAGLILAVWAASRFPEEMQRSRFSILWLPVPYAEVSIVKLFPGVVALTATAAWSALMFWLIAPTRFGKPAEVNLLAPAAMDQWGNFFIVYCLAFAASLYSNMVAGALVGFVGGLLVFTNLSHMYLNEWLSPLLSLCVSVTHWCRNHPGVAIPVDFMDPELLAEIAFALAIALGGLIAFHRSVAPSPKRRAVWGIGSTAAIMAGVMLSARLLAFPVPQRVAPSRPTTSLLPSPDGKRVALIRGKDKLRLLVVDLNSGREREMLTGFYLDLIAWTPDSKSVFVETAEQRQAQAQIIELNEGGRVTRIASLPPKSTDRQWNEGAEGEVTPGGRYLVLRRKPLAVDGFDLWSIDLRTNRARVIAANISRWKSGAHWNLMSDDTIILGEGDGSFRELALDGSGVKRRWEER